MDEEWRPGADIAYAIEFEGGPGPRRPGGWGQCVGFGTDTQKIKHHVLAIAVPAGFNEAVLGGPAHGKSTMALQHPEPIDTLKNRIGQLVYFSVVKIGAAGEHAAKKDGGVDGGNFRLEDAFTILNVQEVSVKPMLVLHPSRHETQGVANAIANFQTLLPAALVGNAMSGKSEAGGGNAGSITLIGAVG